MARTVARQKSYGSFINLANRYSWRKSIRSSHSNLLSILQECFQARSADYCHTRLSHFFVTFSLKKRGYFLWNTIVIEMAIRVKSMLAIMATTRLVYSREGSMRIRDASLKCDHDDRGA
jgi:hypothetical protein